MAVLTAAQVAQLVKQAGFPDSAHVTMVAIAKAESGFNTEAVNPDDPYGGSFGLFQINGAHKLDSRRLLSDAAYNTQAAKNIYDSQGLIAWGVYTSGAYEKHLNEARQGVAQAAGVTGNPAVPGTSDEGASAPAVTYGPLGPQIVDAGVGVPLLSAEELGAPLKELLIQGTAVRGDFAPVVLGAPIYSAGIGTVPNLVFTVADPEGELLWRQNNLFQRGNLVQYRDDWFRIDQTVFEPGSHGTGQLSITCVNDIVYALMNLKGPRTAEGISATQWIAQELALAGVDPNRYFLGEAVPTQSVIARDEEDQEGNSGGGEDPSGWTTAVRLSRELGKRIFVSGRRLVFGSSAFAMQWTAAGAVQLTRHADDLGPGSKWLGMPVVRNTSVGDRSDVAEVTGRVPMNRAKFLRPGVAVDVTRTPAIAGGEFRRFMCSNISFNVGTDTDGADVTLLLPVDPPPQPPQQKTSAGVNGGTTGNGEDVSGGGTDAQIDRFVALALQQAGKAYVWGANPGNSPNPGAFDCSSLVQWAALRSGIPDPTRTTYTQIAKIRGAGRTISVQQAINTKGALLFNNGPEHVAISLGNGKTIEAMNSQAGVRQGDAAGRFVIGGLLVGATGYKVNPGAGRGLQPI
ncbi:MAG: transglycosylase SLT domain-containing protein [Saccharothrix sp.]|nr:transglycosylase SLT domain-containing protein [Saccharothrix sp.]